MLELSYTDTFTAATVVVITHSLNIFPTQCDIFDATGHAIPVAHITSVVHTLTTTTLTFTEAKTGSATVIVCHSRVGDLRISPDGTWWAVTVDNDGILRTTAVS